LLLRGHVTAILAPGGVGKSVFSISLGISVALGQRLLGYDIRERTNVLLVNNEDDCSEIDRRVAGICEHWEIPFGDLDQRVFILAGYGSPLVLAEQRRDGTVEPTDAVDGLISEMRGRKVGLLVLDPFVSLHRVEENNNVAVEQVLSILRRIANETGAAVLLVHHTRKGQGGNAESHAGDADAGRGASALVYGTRAAFTLARMSKETAKKSHIEWDLGNRLFRLDSAKSNYAVSLGMTLDEAKAILANSPARDDDFRTVQLAFGKVASRSGELLSAARERRLARERGEKANGKTVGGKATNKRPD
jgi:hypothetical protein